MKKSPVDVVEIALVIFLIGSLAGTVLGVGYLLDYCSFERQLKSWPSWMGWLHSPAFPSLTASLPLPVRMWCTWLAWWPVGLMVWFVLFILVRACFPPKEVLRRAEDDRFEVLHNGLDSPELHHFAALAPCLGDLEKECRDYLKANGVSLVTPRQEQLVYTSSANEEQALVARERRRKATA